MRTGERGFTYLLLLFGLATGAAALAAALPGWQTAMQRERETELLFRGGEIARALARYRDATPQGRPTSPEALEELLEDRRGERPVFHLRRIYPDPFSGLADWQIERDADGRITGVRSRAQVPALRRTGMPFEAGEANQGRPPRVGDWVFRAPAPAATGAPADRGVTSR